MKGKEPLARYAAYIAAVEEEMRASFPTKRSEVGPFYGMMAYHLGWRDADLRPVEGPAGKRLRPLLCLLACEVTCGEWQRALPAAAAVELLHNFTLIHDDIEDDSPLRRGRPTVWRIWGIPQAINAGDGLFTLSRMALLRLQQRGVGSEVILQAVTLFDRAILEICEGQHLDLSFEGRLDLEEEVYISMIARKTAALIEASLCLGALVGGEEDLSGWRSFGRVLGLAFQVQDDLLGVWGREERTGKPAAADLYRRKLGLPVVYALTRSQGADRQVLERVYGGEGTVGEEEVAAVLAVLERVEARRYGEARAATYLDQAMAVLPSLPAGPARDALESLALALVGRET